MGHSTGHAGGAGLAELEKEMRDLVALLGGARTSIETLERAWNACAVHAPRIAAAATTAIGTAGSERAALRRQLERILELNAVARDALRAEQEALMSGIVQARAARATLSSHAGAEDVGSSCDVAG